MRPVDARYLINTRRRVRFPYPARCLPQKMSMVCHPGVMGKHKKGGGGSGQGRTRVNPLTGEVEQVSGTKAGKKRMLLPGGHPLRTHDIHGPTGR